MSEQEGVIKYLLEHQCTALPSEIDISEINAWRSLLYRLKLIGQLPEKYDGLGYGNISRRIVPGGERFLITGTQTGDLAILGPEHFALVDSASPLLNSIHATGPRQPSSEALTHACVYLQNPAAQAVIHVHCPELWRNTRALNLPHTDADVTYGSIEMASAVERLFTSGQLQTLPIFSMLGHEDGIVAFGDSLAAAGTALIRQLALALSLEQRRHAG